MKKMFVVALAALAIVACENKQKPRNQQEILDSVEAMKPFADRFPVIKIDSPSVNLGTITEGDTIYHTYRFSNAGNMPLAISNVVASCGCTTPSYTTNLIAPGEQGFIKVMFNSKNKEGKVHKTITVHANTNPAEQVFSFNVEVLKKQQ